MIEKQIFIPHKCKWCNCSLFRFDGGFRNYRYQGVKHNEFYYYCVACGVKGKRTINK